MTEIREVDIAKAVDGVFVGGGHNALVCAAYLARAGLQVLVLEAAPHIGGGTTTDEVTLPLFKHNLHAYFVRWTPEYAVWNDLDLGRYSVRSIYPEVQNAVPFDGGERALVTYADLERSLVEIARISSRDAEIYRRLHDEFSALTRRVDTPIRFSPPLPTDEMATLLDSSKLGRRYLELNSRSPLEIVSEEFESEPLRSLILFNVAVGGYLPILDVRGIGSIVALALTNSHQGRLVEGGTFEVARAIAASVIDAGGSIVTGMRVTSIEISNGRAVGVQTEDGRKIHARRFVISAAPAPITMLELVGRSNLDPGLRDDLDGYRLDSSHRPANDSRTNRSGSHLVSTQVARRTTPQMSLAMADIEADVSDMQRCGMLSEEYESPKTDTQVAWVGSSETALSVRIPEGQSPFASAVGLEIGSRSRLRQRRSQGKSTKSARKACAAAVSVR